jgi:uncharacterized protein YyaL (SSP411 family)
MTLLAQELTRQVRMWREAAEELKQENDALTKALEHIALYEESGPEDPSDVYEHFQAVAREALREPVGVCEFYGQAEQHDH